ncbi:MAG: CbtA family protein [Methylocystis sp.]|nr:CbtA family protein [Methylocystis sp.]
MIQRALAVGVIAGLAVGLAMAALQHVTTTPLILAAEVYETAAEHSHAGEAATEEQAWAPAEGLERTIATSVATSAAATGYALMLLALMLLAGEPIEPLRGLAWGACAFAATGLATSLGLAPELPGSAAGDLLSRQIWWIATVALTGAGLFALLRMEAPLAKLIGAALIIAPHLVGAPQPAAPMSTVPAELAARFTATSLAMHALTWILLGAMIGFVWRWLADKDAAVQAGAPT